MATKETTQNYSEVDRPYDDYMQRSEASVNEQQMASNAEQSNDVSGISNSPSNSNGSVEKQPVKEAGSMNDIWIRNYIRSENWKPKSVGFYINGLTGYAEFTNVYVSGVINASSGMIGGWTIGDNELYATTTGTIKTSATAGSGSDGVVLDKDGLRVYNAVLGLVVNLPSDGSAPTFSSGVINETIFEISTNAVLRTSSTVGDGSASSAGVLINNAGIFATEANQLLANANVKILVDGSASFKGTITASAGLIGGFTIASTTLSVTSGGNTVIISSGATAFTAGPTGSPTTTISQAGVLTTTNAVINGQITATSFVFKDSSNNNVMVGGASGGLSAYVVEITATSNVHNGIRINLNQTSSVGILVSSNTSSTGFYYTNTTNIRNRGIYVEQTSSGSSNDYPCIELAHNGTAQAMLISVGGAAGGVRISNYSSSPSIAILQGGGSNRGIDIRKTGGNYGFYMESAGSLAGTYIATSGTSTNNHAIHIIQGAANSRAIFIESTSSSDSIRVNYSGIGGYLLDLVASNTSNGNAVMRIEKAGPAQLLALINILSSSASSSGIYFNMTNSGAGLEYAFDFNGHEYSIASVGGSQDRKIRILIGGTTYFIPCYTA